MSKERIDLIVIDPQNDFCSPDAAAKQGTPQEGDGVYEGTLYVPGAEKDMQRVSEMIDRMGTKITNIHVTLDCHYLYDIAHIGFWRNSAGENPEPFTIITYKDIVDGVWFPIFSHLPIKDLETGKFYEARKYVKEYAKKLEDSGRYPLCIYNPHCLISKPGNNVVPVLSEALTRWEENNHNNVNFVSKGSNICTEHYSAIMAEIPDPNDASTGLNTRLIKTLMDTDKILIAGEAKSHCLKFSVEDIANNFSDDSYIKKLCLLEDGTSSVISPFVDFPAIAEKFV